MDEDFAICYYNPECEKEEIFIAILKNKKVFHFFIFKHFINCVNFRIGHIEKLFKSIDYLHNIGWILMDEGKFIETVDCLSDKYEYIKSINTLSTMLLSKMTRRKISYIEKIISNNILCKNVNDIILKYIGSYLNFFRIGLENKK